MTYIDERELHSAYLAGLFDGEGHISLAKRGDGSLPQVMLGVSNKCKPLLEPLKETYGGGIYLTAGCWVWSTNSGPGALKFLQSIQPCVRLRFNEVLITIEICKRTNPPGHRYTDKELVLRGRLMEKLQEAAKVRREIYCSIVEEETNNAVNVT